jgi:hypothetical protein
MPVSPRTAAEVGNELDPLGAVPLVGYHPLMTTVTDLS